MPHSALFQYQGHTEPVLATPERVSYDKWGFQWSEPIVKAKRGLRPSPQMFFTYASFNPIVSFAYYNWLTEPKRFKKGLGPHLQKFINEQDTYYTPRPDAVFGTWYPQLSLPVRVKPRLRTGLQPAWVGPHRLLPPVNVTATMSASEINADQATFVIRVLPYNPPASAAVSVEEVGTDGSATSVWED